MPEWLLGSDFTIARWVLQRGMGLVYLSAYAVALFQFRPLLGEKGLLPVPRYLKGRPFWDSPSIFYFGYSDRRLVVVSAVGIGLSIFALAGIPDTWPVPLHMAFWLTLWGLYLSIVNVGQIFYSFGWESLLLEAGFLAVFLGPAWTPVPLLVLWLFRWLLFRVEFGAGLIKMRGDPCWKELTCLDYHHETQPLPNGLSWFFHHLPKRMHRMETLGSHFAQLVAPIGLFLPQPIAMVSGLIMVFTQAWLVLSGNYAWLNWLTMLLGFSAIPDGFWGFHVAPAAMERSMLLDGMVWAVTILVLVLSYRPARNLVSPNQKMNATFEPLHLVNTYGAFGSVTRHRNEVIIEGMGDDHQWREYEFKGKPTALNRRPGQFAPYHLRLDWLMWFAALSPGYAYSWLEPLMEKLLENDPATLRLLRKSPFPDKPPRAVRALLYRYRFTTWRERRETGAWWVRTRVGDYIPPIERSSQR